MSLQSHPESSWQWTAAFVLSAVLHAGAFVWTFDLWPGDLPGAPPRPVPQVLAVSFTSSIVDPELLSGSGEDPGLATGDPGETLAAVAPEDPETIRPEDPEQLAAVEPETIQPEEAAERVTPEGTEPEELIGAEQTAGIPDMPEPEVIPSIEGTERVSASEVANSAPEVFRPLALDGAGAGTLSPIPTVNTGGGERLAAIPPTRLPPQTATAPTPAPPATPPSPAELEFRELVQQIRGRLADPCLVALPRRAPEGSPLVALVSDDEAAILRLRSDVLEPSAIPLDATSFLIDARQCPAINFARAQPTYPAFRLALTLTQAEIQSGESLTGVIENTGGRYTTLLLIDDNGVVQDLRRFISFTGGRAIFDVPMTRNAPARDTGQILLAIATDGRPATVDTLAGNLAEAFFPPLEDEIGTAAAIALRPFYVR